MEQPPSRAPPGGPGEHPRPNVGAALIDLFEWRDTALGTFPGSPKCGGERDPYSALVEGRSNRRALLGW